MVPARLSSANAAPPIEPRSRPPTDGAAALLGETETVRMTETARLQAIDLLRDQRLLHLDARRYGAFVAVLDHPPAPAPRLRSLSRRVPMRRQ